MIAAEHRDFAGAARPGQHNQLGQERARAAHRVHDQLTGRSAGQPHHRRRHGRPQARRQMLRLVGAMPHGRIREPQPAHGLPAVNRQPDFDRRIFVHFAPTGRQLSGESARERLPGIDPPVAVRTGHLRDEMKGWLAGGFRPDSMVQFEQRRPIGRLRRPLLDLFQVRGAIGQFVGSPRQQEYIFDGAQLQQFGCDIIGTEDDQPALGLAHGAAEIAGDLFRGDRFDAGLDGGVKRREIHHASLAATRRPKRSEARSLICLAALRPPPRRGQTTPAPQRPAHECGA